jgi:ATP-dependent helicase HrpB
VKRLSPLPIDDVLSDVTDALRGHSAVVLRAPPGAGKTTRVPGAVLDAGLAGDGQVIMLEPRRLAARASAKRIAEERGVRLGGEVGYRVRFENKSSDDTRLLVVTEGILTRRFLDDPLLEGAGCIILDEFHERSVHTDLCLAFVRELLEVRDDLKLIVMSATIDAAPLSSFLGDCPVVTSEGRLFPLDVQHSEGRDDRRLEVRVRAGLRDLLRADDDDGGDVLVFLPGAPEIRRAQQALEDEPLPGAPEVVPLHGSLPPEAQDRALARAKGRRVVLATNIAETSLTLDGVSAVVDTGLQKLIRHDPRTGTDRLETVRICRYSAEQRAGRAGRQRPGRVLRLWSAAEHAQLAEKDSPELARVDLAGPLLQVLFFSPGDPRAFAFLDPPPDAHTARALELLERLGATERDDERLQLSERGRRLAHLPVSPRIGALLEAAAEEGRAEDGAAFAALLGERELLRRDTRAESLGAHDSDLEVRLELLEAVEADRFSRQSARAHGVDERSARETARARDQLRRLVKRPRRAGAAESDARAHARILLAGFPDRVCVASGGREGKMVGGRGVKLDERSVVHDAELFVALQVDDGAARRARSLVRMAAKITREDLEAELPHLLRTEEAALFDDEGGRVRGVRRLLFADLVLEEKEGVAVSPEAVERALLAAAQERWERFFRPDADTQRLLDRLRFAAAALPEEEWPDVSEERLRTRLPALVPGARSLKDLEKLDWRGLIEGELSWPQKQLLDVEVPERLAVPSGSKIAIDYAAASGPEEAPVLAVKLQEMFGLAETPRVARGRVPLLLHLLSPARRPVQVTRDLRSFWDSGYVEVRKELRQRYPKHPWPEDPWNAPAQRGTKKRRR